MSKTELYLSMVFTDLGNCEEFQEVVKENWEEWSLVLLRDNRRLLHAMFGSPAIVLTKEFRYHIYFYPFKGLIFEVSTAKTKGTCYAVNKLPEFGVITSFLRHLRKALLQNILPKRTLTLEATVKKFTSKQ